MRDFHCDWGDLDLLDEAVVDWDIPTTTINDLPAWWLDFVYNKYDWNNHIKTDFVVIRLGGRDSYFTVVSPEDAERVMRHNWTVTVHKDSETGEILKIYAVRWRTPKEAANGSPKRIYLHRFIAGVIYAGSKTIVDHNNGFGLDNRRENLTVTNEIGNKANAVRSNKTGLPRGVSAVFSRTVVDGKKAIIGYRAFIKVRGKQRASKRFSTPARAARWYRRMHARIYPVSTVCTGKGRCGPLQFPPVLACGDEIPF